MDFGLTPQPQQSASLTVFDISPFSEKNKRRSVVPDYVNSLAVSQLVLGGEALGGDVRASSSSTDSVQVATPPVVLQGVNTRAPVKSRPWKLYNPFKALNENVQSTRSNVAMLIKGVIDFAKITFLTTIIFGTIDTGLQYWSEGQLGCAKTWSGTVWTALAGTTLYKFQSSAKTLCAGFVALYAVENWWATDGILPTPWEVLVGIAKGTPDLVVGTVRLVWSIPDGYKASIALVGCAVLVFKPLRSVVHSATAVFGQIWKGAVYPLGRWVFDILA